MRQLTSAFCLGLVALASAQTTSPEKLIQSARELNSTAETAASVLDDNIALADSLAIADSLAYDSILHAPVVIRELPEILASLQDTMPELPYNPIVGPWVFSGYRSQKDRSFNDVVDGVDLNINQLKSSAWHENAVVPDWLHNALTQSRISQDYMYTSMVYSPHTIQYTYWDLPVPPRLPEDDVTLGSYIKNLNLPEIAIADALLPEFEQQKSTGCISSIPACSSRRLTFPKTGIKVAITTFNSSITSTGMSS